MLSGLTISSCAIIAAFAGVHGVDRRGANIASVSILSVVRHLCGPAAARVVAVRKL